jgi:hypothetical protein
MTLKKEHLTESLWLPIFYGTHIFQPAPEKGKFVQGPPTIPAPSHQYNSRPFKNTVLPARPPASTRQSVAFGITSRGKGKHCSKVDDISLSNSDDLMISG